MSSGAQFESGFDEARLEFWRSKPELVELGEWEVSIHCKKCKSKISKTDQGITGVTDWNYNVVRDRVKCPHCLTFEIKRNPSTGYYSGNLPHFILRRRFIKTGTTTGWFSKKPVGFYEYQEIE